MEALLASNTGFFFFFFKEINVIAFLLFVENLEVEKKREFLFPDIYIFLISYEMPQVPLPFMAAFGR